MEKVFQSSIIFKLYLRIKHDTVNCYEMKLYDGNIHSKCIVTGCQGHDFTFIDLEYNVPFKVNISEIQGITDAGEFKFSSVSYNNYLVQTKNKHYIVAHTAYFINGDPVLFVDRNNNIYVFKEDCEIYFANNELGFYYDISENLLYFVKFSFNPSNHGWYYYKLHNDGKIMLCHDDHDLCNFMKRNYVIDSMANKINIINN